MTKLTRREFLKLAGGVAGTAAVWTFLPGVAFSAGGDEAAFAASAISNPTFIAPAIIAPGAGIPLGKTALGQKAALESIWLSGAGGEIFNLESSGNSLAPAAPAPPGLYDLYAKISLGGKTRIEKQPHAVRIVEEFKKDFTFGIISDVHFGDPRITSKIPDFSVADTFAKEIDILNDRGVEFCLCCGDLCFLPPKTKKEIMEYAELLAARARFPIFTVPGNHDGYATGAAARISFDTYDHWNKFFGPLDFTAAYGEIAIIGINTFDRAAAERNLYGGYGDRLDVGSVGPGQLTRLDATLAAARARGATILAFGHHNPTNTVTDVNGPFEIVPFSATGRAELLSLLEKHRVDYYFAGHVHGAHYEKYAETEIYTVPTAASLPADGHPVGLYVATVTSNRISSVETIEMARV